MQVALQVELGVLKDFNFDDAAEWAEGAALMHAQRLDSYEIEVVLEVEVVWYTVAPSESVVVLTLLEETVGT